MIEMMVVVLIIMIAVTIAMPGIANRMKSNQTKVHAEKVALLIRQAKIRSMGRAAAVIVRYNNGVLEVREGIQGVTAAAGCQSLPESSCLTPLTRWNNGDRSRRVRRLDVTATGTFTLDLVDPAGTAIGGGTYDVCFTPSGRSFARSNLANPLTPLVGPIRLNVDRNDGVGFMRVVSMAPNGAVQVSGAP